MFDLSAGIREVCSGTLRCQAALYHIFPDGCLRRNVAAYQCSCMRICASYIVFIGVDLCLVLDKTYTDGQRERRVEDDV